MLWSTLMLLHVSSFALQISLVSLHHKFPAQTGNHYYAHTSKKFWGGILLWACPSIVSLYVILLRDLTSLEPGCQPSSLWVAAFSPSNIFGLLPLWRHTFLSGLEPCMLGFWNFIYMHCLWKISWPVFVFFLFSQILHGGVMAILQMYLPLIGLGGSVGCAVRLETRRSRVQPPPRSATFFRGDWSWNIFYGHSLPSADSRRAVVSFWRKNVHNTG